MAETKCLVFLLYTMTFILSLPSVSCRPINMCLPWLTSREAAVQDTTLSSVLKHRESDSEKMALMLAAVENLTDAIKKTGVCGEAKLKTIKANILVQVFDHIRNYFSTSVPKTSETTEPCVTTAGTSCLTTSKPCITTSTPHTTTSTLHTTTEKPCVFSSTPRTTTKNPRMTTTKKSRVTTPKPRTTTKKLCLDTNNPGTTSTPCVTGSTPCVTARRNYKLWKFRRNPVTTNS